MKKALSTLVWPIALRACAVVMVWPSFAFAQGAAIDSRLTRDSTVPVVSPPPPFTLKIGGYFKPQMIFDFSPAGNTDAWDPRTIPVDGSEGQNFRIHARDSRFSLDVRVPAQARELRMFVEADFAEGTGYTLRLRHAYGTWGSLLAGQTWSTFMDELVIPKTIDLEPPMSFPFLRVAQMRVTHTLSERGTWSIAVEDPAHKLDIPATMSGKEEHPAPDVTGRLRWVGGTWHAQLSGFAGLVRFRPLTGDVQQSPIWGAALGGKTELGANNAISGQVTVGSGVGRFRGAIVAAFDDRARLRPVDAVGVVASFDHVWSARFSSNASYGWAGVRSDVQRTADPTRSGSYATANLLWWFLPAKAWFGGEYLFGQREVESGRTGKANRVQAAVKFFIP